MATYCHASPCCSATSYKKCTNLLCISDEERVRCPLPNYIKDPECVCVLQQANCRNDGETFGFDDDDGQFYLWVDNGCQGNFKFCANPDKKSSCHKSTNITTTTIKSKIPSKTTSTYNNMKRKPTTTTQIPKTKDMSVDGLRRIEGSEWKSALAIIPVLALIIAVLACIFYRERTKQTNKSKKKPRKPERTYTQTTSPNYDNVYTEIDDDAANMSSSKRLSNIPIYNICKEHNNDQTDLDKVANGHYYVLDKNGSSVKIERDDNSTDEDKIKHKSRWSTKTYPEYFIPIDEVEYSRKKETLEKDKYATPYDSTGSYFILDREAVEKENVKQPEKINNKISDDYFVLEKVT